jgi:hypothetical protein
MKFFYPPSFSPSIPAALLSGLMLTALPAADFGMEWLALPEAYTWPAPLPDAAEFKPESVPVRALPAPVQALLKQAAEGHSLPAAVEQCRADLNGDGEMEWILSVPPLSALGGEVYVLIRHGAEGHVILGTMQGHLALLEPSSGWVQIVSLTKNGAERFSRFLWRFHEGRYRPVRREDHDFSTGRAAVIKGLDKDAP